MTRVEVRYPAGTTAPPAQYPRRRPVLTVQQVYDGLRELLEQHPEAAALTVDLEGCDCSGEMVAVCWTEGHGSIEFERNP